MNDLQKIQEMIQDLGSATLAAQVKPHQIATAHLAAAELQTLAQWLIEKAADAAADADADAAAAAEAKATVSAKAEAKGLIEIPADEAFDFDKWPLQP